jgi:AcrR family transcriptional regulator
VLTERTNLSGPVRGVTRKSQITRRNILNAAAAVLRERGHSGFTIPRVASAAGLYQGNVTYYFPTRIDMIDGLVDHVLVQYQEEFDEMLRGINPNDPNWPIEYIEWAVDTCTSQDHVALFPELWSIANQLPEVADAMVRMYARGVDAVIETLGHDPAAPETERLHAVIALLFAVAEGSTAINGHREAEARLSVEVRQMAIEILAPLLVEAHRVAVANRSAAAV